MNTLQEISTDELLRRMDEGEQFHLIDIREDFEVAMGMIPGAVHIPMNTVPVRLDEFDPETEYVLVCRAANRTRTLGDFMAARGFKVAHMTGGMLEWRGEVIIPTGLDE